MRLSFLAPILVMVASCSQLKVISRDYVEPSGGESAKIRFSTNGEIVLIPNRNCLDWSAPDSGVVVSNKMFAAGKPAYNGRKLGMTGDAPAGFTSAEVKVRGGVQLAVQFDSREQIGDWVYTCSGAFTFAPKAGDEYAILVYHDVGAGYCRYEPKSLLTPAAKVPIYKVAACK